MRSEWWVEYLNEVGVVGVVGGRWSGGRVVGVR